MSTKIWEAYRIKPPHNMWDVVHELRTSAEYAVRERLWAEYMRLQAICRGTVDEENSVTCVEHIAKTLGVGVDIVRTITPYNISRFVLLEYRKQHASSYKDYYDLDVSISFRRSGKETLLIPYPGSGILRNSLDFMKSCDYLEDFHYQNQVDRAEGISDEEWEHRKVHWEYVLEDNRWRDQLCLDIVSPSGWVDIDPAVNEHYMSKWRKDNLP